MHSKKILPKLAARLAFSSNYVGLSTRLITTQFTALCPTTPRKINLCGSREMTSDSRHLSHALANDSLQQQESIEFQNVLLEMKTQIQNNFTIHDDIGKSKSLCLKQY